MSVHRGTFVRITVVVVLVAVVVVVLVAGGFDALRDQDRVEDFFADSGPWGPMVYILGFVALQPLSLPGAVLIIPATFVWPWWQVAIYSILGGLVASVVGFVLARWLAQDWVRRRLPERFAPWEQRLADHGFVATVALRMVTGYAPAADWLLGVSRVTVRSFLAGTLVGLIPGTLAISLWGDDAVRGVGDAPFRSLAVIALIAAIAAFAVRRRRRALDHVGPHPDG